MVALGPWGNGAILLGLMQELCFALNEKRNAAKYRPKSNFPRAASIAKIRRDTKSGPNFILMQNIAGLEPGLAGGYRIPHVSPTSQITLKEDTSGVFKHITAL